MKLVHIINHRVYTLASTISIMHANYQSKDNFGISSPWITLSQTVNDMTGICEEIEWSMASSGWLLHKSNLAWMQFCKVDP